MLPGAQILSEMWRACTALMTGIMHCTFVMRQNIHEDILFLHSTYIRGICNGVDVQTFKDIEKQTSTLSAVVQKHAILQ